MDGNMAAFLDSQRCRDEKRGYPVDAGVDDIENVYGIFDKHVQDMREA